MLLVISMVLFALAISLWWFGRVAFTPVDDTSTTLAILDDSGIRSEIATIKNTGGRAAGASTAAAFLWHFVEDTPWVHLDIAGPAFAEKDKPHQDGGGTGAFVRTLVAVARGWSG